ncbi:MAG: desulfoferrodoxin [Lachnospiraceae bacterium]|nr:desulfoferrodoxin [Lachnospiraceae bacterium]
MKYYICEHCGNIIEYVKETGVPVMCCGQKMTELIPGTSDGAHEKHVPVVSVTGDKVVVEVGAVEHPMVEAHYIQWIAIETTKGSQRVKLEYTDKPRAEFKLADGEMLVEAYEYCNLHGLWKSN